MFVLRKRLAFCVLTTAISARAKYRDIYQHHLVDIDFSMRASGASQTFPVTVATRGARLLTGVSYVLPLWRSEFRGKSEHKAGVLAQSSSGLESRELGDWVEIFRGAFPPKSHFRAWTNDCVMRAKKRLRRGGARGFSCLNSMLDVFYLSLHCKQSCLVRGLLKSLL